MFETDLKEYFSRVQNGDKDAFARIYNELKQPVFTIACRIVQSKELRNITVTDICELAGIERSTFYAHYKDVATLANAYSAQIEKQISELPHKEDDFFGYLTT